MSTPTTAKEPEPAPAAATKEPTTATTEETKKKSPSTSGRQTPRSSKNKTPPASTSTPAAAATPAQEEKKEETEEEKAARLKREEEEELLLRPWMSPAKPSILKHNEEEEKAKKKGAKKDGAAEAEGEGGEKKEGEAAEKTEKAREVAAAPAAAEKNNKASAEDHHIAFKDQPEVFPDHIYATQHGRLLKKLQQQQKDGAESPVRQIQEELIEIDDVCERLYAEAIAKRRLAEEASKARQRELQDEEAGFDEECTFHPVISEDARKNYQFENWEQFMQHRDERNKQAANRWTKKRDGLLKEQRDKELGEDLKMAPLSQKLLEYKKKKGQPHRGPLKDYDKYLGDFILKKTAQDKGLAAVESGDDSVRKLPDPVAQRELTERLYEDAIARVAARQVIERARTAADKAKLFQPMTNERLIAKLKELNPEADNDSWLDDANVETRLLSQGESYRLRNERRKNQHELESLRDCTFTPRTNPKSRQLLQNWARRAIGGGGDGVGSNNSNSTQRVDRNLDNDGDYAPLNGLPGGKIYATEEEALAAAAERQNNYNDIATSVQSNQGSEPRSSFYNSRMSNNNNNNRQQQQQPRHKPDPEAYFEKVKMRQADRERQLAEKRKQLDSSKEEGCTFRPAMAPLTVALAKIRDDKEFGGNSNVGAKSKAFSEERDREILMPPHLRAKTAQWGQTKGSPRKVPRGAAMMMNNNNMNNSNIMYQDQLAGGYQSSSLSTGRNNNNINMNNNTSRSSPRSYGATPRTATAASSNNNNINSSRQQRQQYRDPVAAQNNNISQQNTEQSSEHFLEDLEHELEGVISNWQSTDGM